ncbi:hypothetical protein ACFU96_21440 [Streptomyces sp. NPDC057620]|uniref:hypothetical protein n=1 Tax=Streptomyces sp. NPDC057620 TaxID=3346185 RepID=UPI00367D1AB0
MANIEGPLTGVTARLPHESGVSHDKGSAETRMERLVGDSASDIRIIEIKPGEVLQPSA